MPALEWQKRFEDENPGLKAFEINLSDKKACCLFPGPAIIPMQVVTPYDVIDRIGPRATVQVQGAILDVQNGLGRDSITGGDAPITPPHSPRTLEDRHPGHPGSNNPSLRKKARPTDVETVDHDELEIGIDNAQDTAPDLQAPLRRGGRAGNQGQKPKPDGPAAGHSISLFGNG
jgi:hypothetical protein